MTLLVDPEPGTRRPLLTSALDGSPRWVAGVIAAVQGAVLSLLVIVVPALGAYVATSADPANDGVEWFRSVRVGTAVWLAGHGVPPVIGGTRLTLVPLGVTLLAVFACWASMRRSGAATRAAVLAGTGAYCGLVVLLALVTGAGAGGALRGVLGGAAVAVTGLGLGASARPEAPGWRALLPGAAGRAPIAVRVGAGAAVVALATIVVAGAVLVLAWIAVGRSTVMDIAESLGAGGLGAIVLALANLLYLPNLVLWATAWLAGPGFVVGAGTHFAPDGTVGGTLPAVPLLGALPEGVPGLAVWMPLVVVAAGALTGLFVHRALRRVGAGRRWFDAPLAALVAGAGAGGAMTVLQLLANGAGGPGRLVQVGAPAFTVGLAVAFEVALGAVVVATVTDPVLHAGARRRWRSYRSRPAPTPARLDD
ncbi:cell division protein PerM [Cellulomonas composti]|uniref:cell division protein PerM n=1 Tax=Cellulomonas composti TaxID=266130 RepID=UPI0011BDB204|nr:DUF6350 family protein [Cellulomonas composti]